MLVVVLGDAWPGLSAGVMVVLVDSEAESAQAGATDPSTK